MNKFSQNNEINKKLNIKNYYYIVYKMFIAIVLLFAFKVLRLKCFCTRVLTLLQAVTARFIFIQFLQRIFFSQIGCTLSIPLLNKGLLNITSSSSPFGLSL